MIILIKIALHSLLPGEHGKILGRLGGVGKSGVLEHKSGNISEAAKRVKIEQTLLHMEGL